MPLWGAGSGAGGESKPKWLTTEQNKQVYATAQGWVAEPGLSGNSNTAADPEILCFVKNLTGTDAAPTTKLAAADITELEFVTTAVAADTPGNFSVLVRFNERVDVTGAPYVTVTNSNHGTSTSVSITPDYVSGTGTNELTFTCAWTSGQLKANDVMFIGANSMNLNGGAVKDAGTNDASTITNTTGEGILQADGITVTAS
jgi:hypothetical protein